jgi:ferredoxin
MNPYQRLAQILDDLPNGYPATESGIELRMLEKLFTQEEASIAILMSPELETPKDFAARTGVEIRTVYPTLKEMARKGLIKVGRIDGRFAFSLLPFVVGIYEFQAGRIDQELAMLFEEYFQDNFKHLLELDPPVHRVIPIHASVNQDTEVHPYESAMEIINSVKSWGVTDCICRTQKALIGDPCEHPLDVCMAFSEHENVFHNHPYVRELTRQEAEDTLQKAADAGLVHSVSNNQEGLWYICNCCTCSCGILRGMAEFGFANVIARSSYVNQVDSEACIACGACEEACQFDAIVVEDVAVILEEKCVGCGVCIQTCPVDALQLVKRPADEVKPPPKTEQDWGEIRVKSRSG